MEHKLSIDQAITVSNALRSFWIGYNLEQRKERRWLEQLASFISKQALRAEDEGISTEIKLTINE